MAAISVSCFSAGLTVYYVIDNVGSKSPVTSAQAAGGKVTSPTGTAPDRYVYYPGTEPLGEGEIRMSDPAPTVLVHNRQTTPRRRRTLANVRLTI